MDDLAAFITARLDEDETAAKAATEASDAADWPVLPGTTSPYLEFRTHVARHDPGRTLRAITAKRVIVEDLRTATRELLEARTREVTTRGTRFWAEDAARVERKQVKVTTLHRVATGIATEWSDHPDYREVWP